MNISRITKKIEEEMGTTCQPRKKKHHEKDGRKQGRIKDFPGGGANPKGEGDAKFGHKFLKTARK